MKKVLALDIDGTLTNSKKEITKPTLHKLMETQKKGHVIAIASGRPLPGIRAIAEELKLNQYGGYVLAFNGGRIVDYKSGDIIYESCIDKDIVDAIYEYCMKKQIGMVTYKEDAVITGTPVDSYMKLEAGINHMEIISVDDFKKAVRFPVNKCLLTAESELAGQVETELNEIYGDRITVFRSEPYFVEIMPKGMHKATALEKLLEYLHMDPNALVACGDGYNDLTMIEYAGVGVAMGNAQQVVKEHADYITQTNDADGLIDVIDRFVLTD